MLPIDRLQRAGATADEIACLEAEPDSVKAAWAAHFEQISDGDIVEWLAGKRTGGYFNRLDTSIAEGVEHDLGSMSKGELIDHAVSIGVDDVPHDMTKAQLIELIENTESADGEGEGHVGEQDSTDTTDAPGTDETPAAP